MANKFRTSESTINYMSSRKAVNLKNDPSLTRASPYYKPNFSNHPVLIY